MLKYSEIKDWDEATTLSKIKDLRVELFKLRMQKTTSGLDTPHVLKTHKKDIAKLLTSLNSKNRK